MENKNIVMLKRHFVNYRNPKQETYYLNQCMDLADYEVIDVTSNYNGVWYSKKDDRLFGNTA